MKTKILLSATFLTLFFYVVNAQVIPNYNFETWTNGINAAPDGWMDRGSNHAGFFPVTQTTDNYLGDYAAKIENKVTVSDTTYGSMATIRPGGNDGFGPAFPISVRYNNLKGFYKYLPQNGDSAQIIVYITKTGFIGPWGNLVAWGEKILGAAATYTPFSVGYLDSLSTFAYMDGVTVPDSAYINISAYKIISGPMVELEPLGNSALYVDALSFDYYLEVNEQMDITSSFVLYPNAGNGMFEVKFNTLENNFATIKIYDLSGKEIMNLFSGILEAGPHKFQYNLQQLTNGNYLYVVATDKGYRAEKITVQK